MISHFAQQWMVRSVEALTLRYSPKWGRPCPNVALAPLQYVSMLLEKAI
jgi:hypothetical protein